jgi:hypothetical protein
MLHVKSFANMSNPKPISARAFENLVDERARADYNLWLRRGQFVPLSFLREQARKKLGYEYRISTTKNK